MAKLTSTVCKILDKSKTFEQGNMHEVLGYLAPCKNCFLKTHYFSLQRLLFGYHADSI